MKRFNMRIGDLEARSCNDNLTLDGEHTTIDIIRWQDSMCWSIAYFRRDKDGIYDMVAIPERLVDFDWKVFSMLVTTASIYLKENGPSVK